MIAVRIASAFLRPPTRVALHQRPREDVTTDFGKPGPNAVGRTLYSDAATRGFCVVDDGALFDGGNEVRNILPAGRQHAEMGLAGREILKEWPQAEAARWTFEIELTGILSQPCAELTHGYGRRLRRVAAPHVRADAKQSNGGNNVRLRRATSSRHAVG